MFEIVAPYPNTCFLLSPLALTLIVLAILLLAQDNLAKKGLKKTFESTTRDNQLKIYREILETELRSIFARVRASLSDRTPLRTKCVHDENRDEDIIGNFSPPPPRPGR